MSPPVMTRRSFLRTFNLAAGGLALGYFPVEVWAQKRKERTGNGEGLRPNLFVHVAPDGRVTLACHRSEMGQGVRSTIPALLADELGADMAKVTILQGDGDKRYGDQNTDGSSSIRSHFEEIRRAAATARNMLIAAAARRWKVSEQSCEARDHQVVHRPSGRKLGFGELANDAGKLPVPKPDEVQIRPNSELRRVFKPLPDVDAPAISTGAAVFGADVRLPGMLIAVIARPPAVGGGVRRYDASRALAVPGVKKVLELPRPTAPYAFQPWGGLAVLADTTWAAMRGRAALDITWDEGPNASYDSDVFRAALSAAVASPGVEHRNVGDVDAALAKAARVVEAEYHVPHLAHVPMEPPVAIARYEDGKCEVWASTQAPQEAGKEAARVLGIDEGAVRVHVTLLGGAFGRKSKADFVSEATWLAKAAGVPVRVQWTREDDLRHDYYNTVNTQRLTAALDGTGRVAAWRQRTAFPPIASVFSGARQPGAGDLQQGILDLPLDVPNVRAEACAADAHVRIGWLRSVYNIFHAFATNSFMDEIAHARDADPREVMLELYGPPRSATLAELGVKQLRNYGAKLEEHPVDVARLRGVIERVTAMAKWNERAKNGRAFGLAAHRSFLSYVAVVASAKGKPDGSIAVDEVWLAADAGTVVNPERARAQMEGAVVFGISHALYGGVTFKRGVSQQSNFHEYRLVRIGDTPARIHVELLPSTLRPGGIGEPGVPPVAPAIANAIFALTGKRLRQIPLRLERVA